jgi:hypothetical protein
MNKNTAATTASSTCFRKCRIFSLPLDMLSGMRDHRSIIIVKDTWQQTVKLLNSRIRGEVCPQHPPFLEHRHFAPPVLCCTPSQRAIIAQHTKTTSCHARAHYLARGPPPPPPPPLPNRIPRLAAVPDGAGHRCLPPPRPTCGRHLGRARNLRTPLRVGAAAAAACSEQGEADSDGSGAGSAPPAAGCGGPTSAATPMKAMRRARCGLRPARPGCGCRDAGVTVAVTCGAGRCYRRGQRHRPCWQRRCSNRIATAGAAASHGRPDSCSGPARRWETRNAPAPIDSTCCSPAPSRGLARTLGPSESTGPTGPWPCRPVPTHLYR